MDEMHSLLKQQLEQCFGASFPIPDAWQGFISAVNDAYWESETDQGICEYSLEMSSQELLQRNLELQAIFQALPDLLLRLDGEGTILTYEAGGTTDFFLDPEALIGKRLQDVSLGDVGESFREAVRQVQQTKDLVSVEYTLTWEEEAHSYEARLSPLLDDQIIVIMRDITEQVQAAEQLRCLKEFHENIVQSMTEGIVVEDAEGYFTFVNPAAAAMLGYAPEELIGSHWTTVIPPRQHDMVKAADERRMQGESDRYEVELVCKDGEHISVQVSGSPLFEEGRFVGTIAVFADITERKQAEEALQEKEELLDSILTASAVGIAHLKDRKILWANDAIAKMFGFTQEEQYLGKDARILYPSEEEYRRVGELIYEQPGSDQTIMLDAEFKRHDGTRFDGHVKISALDPHDPTKGIIASVIDITERKQAEGALRASRQRFRSLFDGVPVGLYRTTPQGHILDANPALVEMLGYPNREALLTAEACDLYADPEDRTRWKTLMEDRGLVQNFQTRLRQYNGTVIWVEDNARLVQDVEGRVCYYEGSLRDITEHKLAEEALRESEERWHLLYESLPGGSFVVNRRYIIEDVNDILCALTGFTKEELIGHSCDIICSNGPHTCPIHDLGKDRIDNEEAAVKTKDGQFVPIIKSARRISVADQEVIVENFQDITERMRAEEELKQHRDHLEELIRDRTAELVIAKERAESASQAKSAFLASMSHELRTPLNAILGYAQVLQQRSLDEDVIDSLNIIQQSGEHLLTLINDVLDISRIETGKMVLHPTPIPFVSFLEHIANIIRSRAEAKGITFTFEKLNALPVSVRADETRLRQVLLNLLDNAVKFTDVGGVTLRVESREYVVGDDGSERIIESLPSPSDSSPTTSYASLRFEVEDTGMGIPTDQLERIFQPFEQAEEVNRWTKGAGLGLAISRQLVQLMGGEIYVESPIFLSPSAGTGGPGSRFWFDVVFQVIGEAAESTQTSEKVITSYKGPRHVILVVDDIPSNRAVLVKLLASLGFEVVEAADGQQALHLARELHPDLILMDRWMPVLDGFEAVRLMRQMQDLAEIPVIAVSASVSKSDQAESREAGVDGFLPKPVDWSDLTALLEEHLGLTWEIEGEMARDLDEPRQVVSEEGGAVLIPPPDEELEILLDLALRGNMRAIRERAAHIETLGEQYVPFARKLRDLAKGFEDREILALLQRYGTDT